MWVPLGLFPLFDRDAENLAVLVDIRSADHAIAGAATFFAKPQEAGCFGSLRDAIDQQSHRRAARLAAQAIELVGLQWRFRRLGAVFEKAAQAIPKDQEGAL